MKIANILLLSLATTLLPITAFCITTNDTLKQKMMADLDIIKNSFEVKYAPSEWKKSYNGWDLDDQINQAKEKIHTKENITVKDYQRIVDSFFKSTRDHHVVASFYSTEASSLPFTIQSVNDKYFITWMSPEITADFPSTSCWSIGDEVITFDNRPIHEVFTEFKQNQYGNSTSKTDQAFAEITLTFRMASQGCETPNGPVTVTVKHANSEEISSSELTWAYIPEEIENHFKTHFSEEIKDSLFQKEMCLPFYKQIQETSEKFYQSPVSDSDDQPEPQKPPHFPLGATKSFVPVLGKLLWQTSLWDPFYAYLFKTSNGDKVGYIRIPHFSGSVKNAEAFAEIISLFEKKSRALIIDEVNNPGGGVIYMYALLSMLSKKPLLTPLERVTLIQADIAKALKLLDELEDIESDTDAQQAFGPTIMGYYVDQHFAQTLSKYFKFTLSEWNAGKTITDPCHFFGIDYISPHPKISYSKPILILVNNLSISCGDFFPAIMQDNQRATIFGSQTAGAGGYLLKASHPNRFGIAEYTYTGSIAERLDKTPIENLGVTPDVPYALTEKDLQEGYCDYASAVKKTIKELIKKDKIAQKKKNRSRKTQAPKSIKPSESQKIELEKDENFVESNLT